VAYIDPNALLMDLTGKALALADGRPLTLRQAIIEALLQPYPDEDMLSGEEKLRRYKLANLVARSTELVHLTAEQLALIKILIAKYGTPLLVGCVYEMIDPEPAQD
jgi:hypothetical protein